MSPPSQEGRRDEGSGRVRIPADVDRPDKLLAGLTARQLAIVAAGALVLWAGYAATRHVVPVGAYAAVALPVAALVAVLAIGRVEGVPADRFVAAALRHLGSPRRLVPAPDGVPAPPAFLGGACGPLPSPLRLPLSGIGADGIVDLGPDGLAITCRASAVTFSLRTPGEQEALVSGFARFLNGLADPVQILVRSAPLDVGPAVRALLDAAPGLPHVALERAARDHARFLGDLAEHHDLLRREVLVTLRQPKAEDAASRLRRRAKEAVAALAAAGVTLRAQDGPGAASLLASCLDPAAPPGTGVAGSTDEPVTRATAAISPAAPAVRHPQEGAHR
ncbi:MAG: PrgI family protein [Acidimicrobiales bacterium]